MNSTGPFAGTARGRGIEPDEGGRLVLMGILVGLLYCAYTIAKNPDDAIDLPIGIPPGIAFGKHSETRVIAMDPAAAATLAHEGGRSTSSQRKRERARGSSPAARFDLRNDPIVSYHVLS